MACRAERQRAKALLIGTYEVAIHNMLRRVDDQGEDRTQFCLITAFAAICGTASSPVSPAAPTSTGGLPAVTGKVNATLHHMVKVRMSYDPPRFYRDRHLEKGWTISTVFCALKRTVARGIFQALTGHCAVPD